MRYVYLLIASLFFACQPSPAPTKPAKLLYLSNRSGNFDIFLTDHEGKEHKQLTQNLGWDWAPQWNQSQGGFLYNSSDTNDVFAIQLMDIEGNLMALETYGLEEFILSPDGQLALYTVSDSSFKHIYAFDTQTQTKSPLVQHPSFNNRPKWSPSGKSFSFISDRDGNPEIYLYEIESAEVKRLTKTSLREKYTSWGPEAENIYFTSHNEEDSHNDIFRLELSTLEISPITQDSLFYEEIAVSPSGERIAFHAQRNEQDHIFTIGIDGSAERQITTEAAYHGEPAWVPQK